jgi:hypothetical protein
MADNNPNNLREIAASWNAGYRKAHGMFDEEKYEDAIKLLDSYLAAPELPGVFKVRFQVLLACCLDDWNEKFAYLDRADNLCMSMRRITPAGETEEIDEALADLREDIEVTRRMFEKDWPGDQDKNEDEDSSGEEQPDAAELLAQAHKVKAKEKTSVTSSVPIKPETIVIDKAEWDAMRADIAELKAVRADLAELKALVTQQYRKQEPQSESLVGQNIKATPDIKMKGKQPSEMTPHELEMSLRPKNNSKYC